MIEGSEPRATRGSGRDRNRRALMAVAVSALVAAGVSAPMALRIGDEPTPLTTEPATTTAATSTTTTTTTTTVPVEILGTTTIREGD